jgi:hypothetical protein
LRSAAARDFISRWFGQLPLGTSSWIHFPALRFSASDPPPGVIPRSPVSVIAAASDYFFPVRSLRQEAEHAALPFFLRSRARVCRPPVLLQELTPRFDFSAASSVLLLLFSAASFLFDWSARQRRRAPISTVDFLIQLPLSKILVQFAASF